MTHITEPGLYPEMEALHDVLPDFEPFEGPVADPIVLPETALGDGIYFGLPEAEYHAQPRLSASGIKAMQASVEDFWHDSWMNPLPDREERDSLTLGNAYHARILEGKEALDRQFAPMLDKADYPDALDTVSELKARLSDLGLKVSGNKPELIERLREANPDAVIWDDIVSAYGKKHAGKTFLHPDQLRRIEYAAAFIEKHPTLGKAFRGGQPEVTILWTDRETGVRMKSRLDYLKVRGIVDLKSFANKSSKPTDKAIMSEIANYRYHIQAAVYVEAIEVAKSLFTDGKVAGKHDPDWLKKCMATPEHQFMFVFQKSTKAPLVRSKVLPRDRMTIESGRSAMNIAMRQFREFYDRFGDQGEPWLDFDAMNPSNIEDDEMPMYAFD
ncbi:PD-(D/E)XK nuclease-like domain-containing protein [Thalassospira xiamenensis]|uniref:PD-(D/E)XK nuclease-like domain-containing protein n=1 Tax=Thalassospira xiamenensis TaxID=220697 RepID=UPI003AA8F346